MKAYQLIEWQQPAELRDVPVPEPGPGEVLIKVGGAGACHSDLHVMDWPAGTLPYELPFTLGRENAGWIEAIGAGVGGWQPDDAVAVYGAWGCGRCAACRQGRETLCERAAEIGAAGGGLGRDGGMAEYMLVPNARLLVALGELDPRDTAPLSDAALTPYHAIQSALPLLSPGTWALVIGVGGLGHMAVQLLRAVSPIERIWREQGLTQPLRRPKKKRRSGETVPVAAQHQNHVWTYDFIFDATAGGKRLKVLSVLYEFTRVALALVPGRSLTSAAVKGVLARLFARHGRPQVIRSDNGPEFIAFELTEWLEAQGAETNHIEPGKPWQNGFGESFHARLRDECLNCEEFWSVVHARVVLESWRIEYNTEHLHSSLDYATPAEFAAAQRRPAALVPA